MHGDDRVSDSRSGARGCLLDPGASSAARRMRRMRQVCPSCQRVIEGRTDVCRTEQNAGTRVTSCVDSDSCTRLLKPSILEAQVVSFKLSPNPISIATVTGTERSAILFIFYTFVLEVIFP
jgi:hypothetical protein